MHCHDAMVILCRRISIRSICTMILLCAISTCVVTVTNCIFYTNDDHERSRIGVQRFHGTYFFHLGGDKLIISATVTSTIIVYSSICNNYVIDTTPRPEQISRITGRPLARGVMCISCKGCQYIIYYAYQEYIL